MNIAAAVLALALAVPAAAAAPDKKILAENADLIVTVSVSGPAGQIASKTRVQAQSQFNSVRSSKGKSPSRSLDFSGVPVINPNNGKARMEFKGRVAWGGEEAVELQSAVEVELGAEAVVYDSEGVTIRLKITAAD